VNVVVMNSIRW